MQLSSRNRDSNVFIILRGMLSLKNILRGETGKEIKEEDGVVLPPKPGPLRLDHGEVILEVTPGKTLLATSLYLQNLILRAEPVENSW